MLVFWVAAAALALLAGGIVVGGAFRAARTPAEADPALGLYRRQMGEIDELAERGLLGPEERRAARAETGRRLLAAAEGEAAAGAAGQVNKVAALAAVAGLAASALVVYLVVGAPGQADQPYAKRLAEWRTMDPATLGPQRIAAPRSPPKALTLGQQRLGRIGIAAAVLAGVIGPTGVHVAHRGRRPGVVGPHVPGSGVGEPGVPERGA